MRCIVFVMFFVLIFICYCLFGSMTMQISIITTNTNTNAITNTTRNNTPLPDVTRAVDLQRPGQGHEACFFSSSVPVETIITVDQTAEFFAQNHTWSAPIVVISPNAECIKKAQKFQVI